MTRTHLIAICVAICAILNACAEPAYHDAEKTIADQTAKSANPALQQPVLPDKSAGSHLIVMDRPLLFTRNKLQQNGTPLRPNLETADGFTLNIHQPISLADLTRQIETIVKIPTGVGNVFGYTAPTKVGSGVGVQTPNTSPTEIRVGAISYQGPLSEFLDTVTARLALYRSFDGQNITIYRYETREFHIDSIAAATQIESDLSTSVTGTGNTGTNTGTTSNTGSSGSSTLSQTKIVQTNTINIWKDLQDTVQTMLPPGSGAIAFPSAGRITVTATPPIMNRIAQYVDSINGQLAQLVYMRFDILAITVQNEDDYAASLSAILNTVGGAFKYSLAGPTIALSSAAQAAASIYKTTVSNPNNSPGLPALLNGSSAIINALSTKLNVVDHIGQTMETFNDRMVAYQDATSTAYIQSASAVPITAGNGLATTGIALTPNQVVTGFSITALPHVQQNGAVSLSCTISISNLENLPSFASGGITVQIPIVDSRSIPYDLVIPNGQTAIVAASDHITTTINQTGTGSPETTILGGGHVGSKNRILILVLVTPWVLNSPIHPNTLSE